MFTSINYSHFIDLVSIDNSDDGNENQDTRKSYNSGSIEQSEIQDSRTCTIKSSGQN